MPLFKAIFFLIIPCLIFSQSAIDIEISQGNYNKALRLIDEQFENGSTDINLFIKKGSVLKRMSNYPAAIKAYLAAYDIDSSNVNITNNLAELFDHSGQASRAEKFYLRSLDINKHNYFANKSLADLYYEKRKYKDALSFYYNILKLDSNNYYAHYNVGKTYYAIDDFEPAERSFKKSIELNKSNIGAVLALSNLYHTKDELDQAIDILDVGLAIDSVHAKLNLKKANLLYLMNKYKEAIPFFKNALKYGDTTNIMLYKQYVVSLEQSFYLDEAIEILNRASLINNEDPVIYFYYAIVYGKKRQLKKSNEYILKAIDLSIPKKQIAIYYAQLANNQYRLGEITSSINFYLKTLEYQPSRYSVFYDIAVIYEKDLNNYKKAIEYYQRYLKMDVNADNNIREYVEDRITKLNEEMFFNGDN